MNLQTVKKLVLWGSASLVLFACGTKQETSSVSVTESPYAEKHRPQIHFSPKEKWMNDPNGMVYYKGNYHLFYQYYPDSTVWGPMHWGHAVSRDLMHWENLPIAIYPDSLGYIFSGSAVVDKDNTSGLGTKENPPLVAIYTYHSDAGAKAGRNDFQTQGLAYSIDDGMTWKKYEKNPVLKNPGIKDFRDPKVSWYEKGKKWIMTLAVQDHIEFYGSPDLLSWSRLGEFGKDTGAHGGVWECPDLFELQVEGSKEKQWILFVSINPGGPNRGSATQYFVGDFDGKKFTQKQNLKDTTWIDYGPDDYAGVTWANAPDGRKIFLGWMNNWDYGTRVPTERWRGATTIPRDIALRKIGDKFYIVSHPVKELQQLVVEGDASEESSSALSILEGEFDDDASNFIKLSNSKGESLKIGWEKEGNRFYIDRTNSGNVTFSKAFTTTAFCPRLAKGDKIPFTVVTDVSSVEVFFDDGLSVMTATFFPTEPLTNEKVSGTDDSEKMPSIHEVRLKKIW